MWSPRGRRRPRRSCGPGLVLVALLVPWAACSPDDEASKPEVPERADAALELSLGGGVGGLTPGARDDLQSAVGDALTAYVVSAFLGDHPREGFVEALESFTDGVAPQAAEDLDLLTGAGLGGVDDVVATRLETRLAAFTPGGEALAVTATVDFAFDAVADDGAVQELRLRGRLMLAPQGDRWRIFGYDLTRDGSPPGTPGAAEAVELQDGVVWVLVLGSDAEGPDVLSGNADIIELVALDPESGRAAAVGIPRDTWVDVDGFGMARINAGLLVGGPALMADEVAQLVGVAPQYVVTTGFDGIEAVVDVVGPVVVRSEVAFADPDYGLDVVRGANTLDGRQAVGFARYRDLPGDDFARIANQQRLLEAVLERLVSRKDEDGFVEAAAVVASQQLVTDVPSLDLYRLVQALTGLRRGGFTACVLDGQPDLVGVTSIVRVDGERAVRLVEDAGEDAVLDAGCDG